MLDSTPADTIEWVTLDCGVEVTAYPARNIFTIVSADKRDVLSFRPADVDQLIDALTELAVEFRRANGIIPV